MAAQFADSLQFVFMHHKSFNSLILIIAPLVNKRDVYQDEKYGGRMSRIANLNLYRSYTQLIKPYAVEDHPKTL